jgi:phosphopantothenoylcysteine decarboxylase / phosphopantothenate---cysteine ligase
MNTISAKHVVLGVTGSIAAYKACEIASTLTKAGVKVTPVMTRSAQQLVGPATFEGLTGNRVIADMIESGQNANIDHIALARSADLFLIAPATANILGKAAYGIADDWLTTALLATPAPILFAPAMNSNMYTHPAVQENIATLKKRGCQFIGPASGLLACKTDGAGRMVEAEEIVDAVWSILGRSDDLAGKHLLLTTGANHEPIDPVRYIGNRSSGKMGFAIAQEALARGAQVTVVTGPADIAPPMGAKVIHVETAQEMSNAVMVHMDEADIIIGAAAVADYRVAHPSEEKHKRSQQKLTIELTENPDIIGAVGAQKRAGQIVVGFAAETNDLVAHAQEKLNKKHLDMIVANRVGTPDSGFGSDTTDAQFLFRDGTINNHLVIQKRALADQLMNHIVELLSKQQAPSDSPQSGNTEVSTER